MSKLREILQGVDTAPAGKCRTCYYLLTLPDEDNVALNLALLDPHVSHTFIATALTRSGYKISESSIRRHRRTCRDAEGPAQQP